MFERSTVLILVICSANLFAEEFTHAASQLDNYELKYPPDFTHFEYVNPNAPKGGLLVLPSIYTLDTLSPIFKPVGFSSMYDHLLVRAGDEPAAYYASLAESMAISADRRRITFRVHPDARWHDGVPITATDVKFTFDTLMMESLATGWGTSLQWFASAEIVDGDVVIHTNSDITKQLFYISIVHIIPAHYWADKDLLEPTFVPPLACAGRNIGLNETEQFRMFIEPG